MTTSTRHDPVKAYRQAEHTRTGTEREQEVLRHLPLVHTVVDRVAAHLPPSVDRDDLFHAGVIGLIDALGRFDPSRDNAFSTYAVMRIRGQIIDELRARDWVSRGARERSREYHQAVNELMSRHGRMPSDSELATHLGVVEDELPAIERDAQLAAQVSLDAPVGDNVAIAATIARPDDEDANPARHLERADRQRLVLGVMKTLGEQDRLVIKLYYFENLLMKEIASVIGVTESRVCQIHSRVIAMLRARLGSDDVFG
jgi:RNA polymerase sigma factor FliA